MPIFTTAVRCFEAVAQEGSIRRAASRLNLTGSAVNRQVIKLEEELGTPLFERLPRGMRLTSAGEVFAATLMQQQRELQGALQQFTAMRGLVRGRVVIAGLSYLVPTLLPGFVARFRARFPGIGFGLHAANSSEVFRMVLDGTADIGLSYAPAKGIPLRRVDTVDLGFGAIVAPDHPLAARQDVSLRDCVQFPLLLPATGMESRTMAEQLGIARWPDHVVAVETNSFASLLELAKAGQGVAFVSDLDAAAEVLQGTLAFVRLKEAASIGAQLCTLVKTGRTLSPAAATALEQLGAELRQAVQKIAASR